MGLGLGLPELEGTIHSDAAHSVKSSHSCLSISQFVYLLGGLSAKIAVGIDAIVYS